MLRRVMGVSILIGSLMSGCGEDEPPAAEKGSFFRRPAQPKAATAPPSGQVDAQGKLAGDPEAVDALPTLSFRDEQFVESVTNRDPFRDFKHIFKAKAPVSDQRKVKMPDTSIDQMKLIAIVSGVARPRAMVTDKAGKGQVIVRGDYIGRPEVIQTGGAEGVPVSLNWRVDRIRSDEVVLSRQDPTAPDRPPVVRVMSLRDEEEG